MAAINKSFVIKNGLEVSTDLIFADAPKNRVGIGTTNPLQKLQIGNVDVSGISTDGKVFVVTSDTKVGIGTTNPLEKFQVGSGSSSFFVTTVGSVGLGITNPQYKLHVIGGIGVTDSFVTGVSTVLTTLRVGTGGTVLTVLGVGNSIGIGTASPAFLLDIRSPVSTGQTALYVQGDVRITGDLSVDDITFDDATLSNLTVTEALNVPNTGIGTIVTFNSTNGTITNLTGTAGTITTFNSTNGTITNLTGTAGTITTFNSTNGTITNLTGTSGTITTFNSTKGTITNGTITNLTGTAGTITTFNSTNGTITNLTGTAGTIGNVKIVSGIITATSGVVTYFGDGSNLTGTIDGIGIGTTGGVVGYAVTFIDFKGAGVSTTFYNSNTGIATIFFEGGGGGGSISISTTAPLLPGSGDLWYSPDYGRTFIYYDENVVGYGTDAFWVDAAPFNVGIITSLTTVSFSPASASAPSIHFAGHVQTGFFSPSSGNITAVSVGSSILNVNPSGIIVTGVTTSTKVRVGTASTFTEDLVVNGSARVVGILTIGSSSITINGTSNIINVGAGIAINGNTGIISATQVFVNGVSLLETTSGNITPTSIVVGSGVTINASGIVASGIITATSIVVGSGVTINASGIVASGIITATDFNATSDINLKENIHTVENALDVVNHLRGVSFDWKENGRSSYGVIAQELETVLPELVGNGETKSVNYNGIVGVLIEAIKELKKEVEEFKSAK